MPMPRLVRKLSLISRLAASAAAACVLLGAGTSAAQAATGGILPPRNPASDCDRTAAGGGYWGVTNINSCRDLEGVGPLTLPSNWNTLTPVEQGFVLIELERVNRGLPPIVGLSATLNRLAANGAASGTDPSFPAAGFAGGGAIWAGAGSVLAADYLWMYDDGPNGFDSNLACPSAGAPGCWGHRDIILWNRGGGELVAGGGYARSGSNGSFAYLILAGYPTGGLSFTWSSELRYFTLKPTLERTGKAASVTRTHRSTKRRTHRSTKRRLHRTTRHRVHTRTKHRLHGHARPLPRRHTRRRTHHRVKHRTHRAVDSTTSASSAGGPTISFG